MVAALSVCVCVHICNCVVFYLVCFVVFHGYFLLLKENTSIISPKEDILSLVELTVLSSFMLEI